jgi:hypothetical protein
MPVVKRVVVKPIVKYEYSHTYENSKHSGDSNQYANPSTQRVLAAMKLYDYDDSFNYTHSVDKDVLIENPLNPISFLDVNHPYNKFTICQMNTGLNDIAVTTKIRG